MGKAKEIFKKHHEGIMYVVFGLLTTFLSWAIYFAVLWAWKAIFSLPVDDTSSGLYIAGYSAAQIIQWTGAVLFAFYTNRRWVFTDADKSGSVVIQLVKFASGRVVTFFIDYGVTLFAAMGAAALIPALTSVELFGAEWNLCEIGAKLLAAVIVFVANYLFSKVFVFKNKKNDD